MEVSADELLPASHLIFSQVGEDLKACQVFRVTVPTPVDQAHRPDMGPLVRVSETVGEALSKGAVVIHESTVYPGATEEVCVPMLEAFSGLKFNVDFFCGYGPERINPGDKQHRLPFIKKITSGSTPEVAEAVNNVYAQIITAGTHKASSIKVAEAAKVIENIQRDVNIALMNERNDNMAAHVADETIKLMLRKNIPVLGSKVLMLGLTLKENCPDLRNDKVVNILRRRRHVHYRRLGTAGSPHHLQTK